MIQILGLRTWIPPNSTTPKKYDDFHKEGWHAKSVAELFQNLESYLEKIPTAEHWNLFYTAANCTDAKRDFAFLGVIVFDIDKVNTKELDSYLPIVCDTLGVREEDTGIVFSGHGLHFIVGLTEVIKEKKRFKELKPHYAAVCRRLEKALEAAGLSGTLDTTVFEPRRIMRLPNTINRKDNKPDVKSVLLNRKITPINFDLTKLSGVETVSQTEQIDPKILAKYPHTDNKAILEECGFIKYVTENPNEIDEPQWYAALSITARMEGGHEISHDISKGHKAYTPAETDEKIAQALEASGPRTCENINRVYGKCAGCPHFQKVTSPILIRGKDHIRTEHTGFHDVIFKGSDYKYIPNIEDLIKYYKREHRVRTMGESEVMFIWKGTHYEEVEAIKVQSFARHNFEPRVKMNVINEFHSQLKIDNVFDVDWFSDTTDRRMNFQNGVLNISTMEFGEHSPDYGFRHVLPYNYDKNAKCPTFDKMLTKVTGNDQSLQDLLLEFMGYALSNDRYWIHAALVLVGEGSNGKSTFINVLEKLAGQKNSSSFKMADLQHEYCRQQLDGKLFNISEETPVRSMEDTSYFKSLVSGDSISARGIYQQPYSFRNKAKLLFTCNKLFETSDTSYGFYRRLILAPFDVKFTKEDPDFDPHIEEKLTLELSGIFNRAMDGYHRLLKNKFFTEVEAANKRKEDFKLASDPVVRWAQENLIIHMNGQAEKHFLPSADLFRAFDYDMQRQREKTISMDKFLRQLKSLYPWLEPIRKRDGGKQRRGYHGLQLVNETEYTENPSNYESPQC